MTKKFDLKLGYACNNNCVHCIMQTRRFNKQIKTSFSLDECLREIRKAAASGYKKISITGGEPTIRKDFLDIMKTVDEQGFSVILQTNGRMLSYLKFAEAMKNMDVVFGIAIHGPTAEIHDKITRTEGSFRQTLQGIRNCIMLNKTVVSKTIITRYNYRYLPDLVDLLRDEGIMYINISFPRTPENCPGFVEKVIPRYSEIEPHIKECYNRIKRREKAGINPKILLSSVPLCFLDGCDEMYHDPIKGKGVQITRFPEGWGDATRYRAEKRTRPVKCNDCVLKEGCCGVYKEYLTAYGPDELKPVLKKDL